MPVAAAWICVDFVNQLSHGVNAIANHQRRLTPSSSHQFVANHQQAIVATRQEFFNQYLTVTCRCFVGLVEQFAFGDVDGDPLALIAILGFDHHR